MKDILLAILSGAVGGAVIQEILEFFKTKKNYIRQQIDNLYGPIYFCIVRARVDFDLSNPIQREYIGFFESGDKSHLDQKTQDRLMERSEVSHS